MFYLVDKPLWISSNLVAKILKRVIDVPKIWFAGTLDPLASGLMIIGTHGSPRLFPLLESYTKTYETIIRLDGTTDSYDQEQPVKNLEISTRIQKKITKEFLEKIIQENFHGEVMQSPPLYSAVWINGKRAYELARKGEYTEKIQAKKRTIHHFNIISYSWPTITCQICVSHGTYIRSIARDMGLLLWTWWYIEKLRRIAIGHISLENIDWIQHNDIRYAPVGHEIIFPDIAMLHLIKEEKRHLRLWSTPINTEKKNGYYFILYDDNSYGLLEAKNWLLYPIKNAV